MGASQTGQQTAQIRYSSREMVRELGFLTDDCLSTGFSHSESHALLEIEQRGLIGIQDLAHALRLDISTVSRLASSLARRELIKIQGASGDKRKKFASLTPRGQKAARHINRIANDRVDKALAVLSPEQQKLVLEGMRTYSRALKISRLQASFTIRRAMAKDNPALAQIIRQVMTAYGACGAGFSIQDAEVDSMYSAYRKKRCAYFVAEKDGAVVGGAGIAPLQGGDRSTCELKKMYLLPEGRGLGIGKELLNQALAAAKEFGFKRCYLETVTSMKEAARLYENSGFKDLKGPMGATGHFSCERWMIKDL